MPQCNLSNLVSDSVYATSILVVALVLAAPRCTAAEFTSKPSDSTTAISTASGADDIEQLIEELGSDQFVLRRRAEALLVELGAKAFDQLHSAEHHPDLEIATRAAYILQQIRIEWAHLDDSPVVRRLMLRYGEFSLEDRRQRINELSSLEQDEGLAALCRIARFDPSPQLSREAALKILIDENLPADRATQRALVILNAIGDSDSPPSEWLRTYVDQLKQPHRVEPRWSQLIYDEIVVLEAENRDVGRRQVVLQLLAYHLKLCQRTENPSSIYSSLQQRIFFSERLEGNLTVGLARAMTWIVDHQQWETLALLEEEYKDALQQERLLLYLSASARDKQGLEELAEQFAKEAFELIDIDDGVRNGIAEVVGDLGQHDWAEREWRYVIDNFEPTDLESMIARRALASWRLHDRGEDEDAAALLAEVCDAVEANPAIQRRIRDNKIEQDYLKITYQQRDFFRACHFESLGKYEDQKKHLGLAFKGDPSDADVLIAMYRLHGADEQFRKTTLQNIASASKAVEGQIKRYPENAQWCNHWAWLISNTEGDYQQAIRYSLKSLELSPDSPSYLDTLGRCYYAAGDLQSAIKVQSKAVELHPQMQVMQRQLEMFEKELAAGENKERSE